MQRTTGDDPTAAQRPPPGVEADAYFDTLYLTPPDFKDLARRDQPLARFLHHGHKLDFNDPAATLQLTKTLARLDFGLELELPDDRLCPPIPNRHSYILWLKCLLDSISPDPPGRELLGLDIGTGASCIYPLLGCAQRPWSFVATDIDAKSHGFAARNIDRNKLTDRVVLLPLRTPADPLIPCPLPHPLEGRALDFVMTNPPFYSSREELLTCAAAKARPPLSACTGAPVEMVADGGEVEFVGRIVDQSVGLAGEERQSEAGGARSRWYSAMLGKLSSVETVVGRLRAAGIDNWAVAELAQGGRTRRWAVAWSLGAMRPSQKAARWGIGAASALAPKVLPTPTEADVLLVGAPNPGSLPSLLASLMGMVNEAISALELLSWDWDAQMLSGVGRTPGNVWARAWRRRRDKGAVAAAGGTQEQRPCHFGFRVEFRIVGESESESKGGGVRVWCRWLEGRDPVMFESFRGWLRRHLAEAKAVGASEGNIGGAEIDSSR